MVRRSGPRGGGGGVRCSVGLPSADECFGKCVAEVMKTACKRVEGGEQPAGLNVTQTLTGAPWALRDAAPVLSVCHITTHCRIDSSSLLTTLTLSVLL